MCIYCNYCEMGEATEVIRNAKQGLLIIGDIQEEEDIWAVILLAKYLYWPVVPDILSGIRLRRTLTTALDTEERILFIDHLDHVLLSDSIRGWAQPDVVVQVCLLILRNFKIF
jgi:isochorismate synthase / 2-succinyl-5-enolpyruvyl-6-hydroxy-3-cyclohexene-1-carboxylate synthase / 2-succinyl-6-hydroxy-2,4-cyclohexadiene-1-carboxylate synthase / o-succinylbenzoate synthase